MQYKISGQIFGKPELKPGTFTGVITDCKVYEQQNDYGMSQIILIPKFELEIDGKTLVYENGYIYDGSELMDKFLEFADEDEGCYNLDPIIGKECMVRLEKRESRRNTEYLAIGDFEYITPCVTEE